MPYFLGKRISPRPTFPMDMTPQERKLMQDHVFYWTGHFEKGNILAFGPVADPQGFWGLGLFEVENEEALRALTGADPIIQADLGFKYKTYPMPQLVIRKPSAG